MTRASPQTGTQAKAKVEGDQERAEATVLFQLNAMTVAELKSVATQHGLETRGKVHKPDFVELLQQATATGNQRRAVKHALDDFQAAKRQAGNGRKRKAAMLNVPAGLQALINEPLWPCEHRCKKGLHSSCLSKLAVDQRIENFRNPCGKWWSCGALKTQVTLPWDSSCMNTK